MNTFNSTVLITEILPADKALCEITNRLDRGTPIKIFYSANKVMLHRPDNESYTGKKYAKTQEF